MLNTECIITEDYNVDLEPPVYTNLMNKLLRAAPAPSPRPSMATMMEEAVWASVPDSASCGADIMQMLPRYPLVTEKRSMMMMYAASLSICTDVNLRLEGFTLHRTNRIMNANRKMEKNMQANAPNLPGLGQKISPARNLPR